MPEASDSPNRIGVEPMDVIEALKRQIGEMAQANAVLEIALRQTQAERDEYKNLAERVSSLERQE